MQVEESSLKRTKEEDLQEGKGKTFVPERQGLRPHHSVDTEWNPRAMGLTRKALLSHEQRAARSAPAVAEKCLPTLPAVEAPSKRPAPTTWTS